MSGYPDEQTWWPDYEQRVAAIYAEAGQPFPDNPAAFRWFTRTAYDLAGPLSPEVSREKHLNELRTAFGLALVEPNDPPMPPLTVRIPDGFFLPDGTRWIWKGCTDFLLYKRFLDGEDIRPILLDRRYVGANLLRVLLQCHNIAHFYPQDYGDQFYQRMPEFSALLSRYGFRWEATVYADEQNIHSGMNHWHSACVALGGVPNVVVELCNEYPKNGIKPEDFSHPGRGLICSRGSGLADKPPARPAWDFFGWHGRRDFPKVTSSTEDMYAISRSLPDGWNSPAYPKSIAVHDEPMGFASNPQPNRRSNDPNLARELAAASVVLGAGGTFHSDDGIQSRIFGPVTKACALAWYSAM